MNGNDVFLVLYEVALADDNHFNILNYPERNVEEKKYKERMKETNIFHFCLSMWELLY